MILQIWTTIQVGRPFAVAPAPDGAASSSCFGDVTVVRAGDPRREAEYLAGQIARMVRGEGFRYRDIAVVCSDINTYARHLERAFNVLEIPCFLDVPRSLDRNPFAGLILSLTEPAERGFTHESVFRILKSGFTGIGRDECDLLENYVLMVE